MGDPITGGEKPSAPDKLTIEAWSEGFVVGAVIIMCGITVANMRRGVLLHKLILIELLLALPNGFFIFCDARAWSQFPYLTAIPLFASWTLHNVIAWLKSKPFLGRRGNFVYIGSILLVQPYWVLEIYANFAYFNRRDSHLADATRPYQAVFRDPWWIFTIVNLFWNIKFRYELGFIEIVQVSPRFGILLLCMSLSVIFIIVDVLSVTSVIAFGYINPFWKLALVFKCFTDSIILDDFKAALDKLSRHRMARLLPTSGVLNRTESGGARATSQRERSPKWPWIPGRGLHPNSSSSETDSKLTQTRTHLSDVDVPCRPSPAIVRHIENGAPEQKG